MRRRVTALLLLPLVSLLAPNIAGAQPDSARVPAVPPPRFQYVGPAAGGRISAVAGIPGDTNTYYIGAASGGIWKTTDGARTFTPIFDDQPVQAIGALAVAPSNPRIVWAGTGEAWAIRDADVHGRRRLQVDGCRRDVDEHGPQGRGRIGTHHRAPDEPRHRVRLRAGPRDRAAGGARRVSHDGRRHDLAARAVREREHRLLRASRWTPTIPRCCSPARGKW